MTCIEKAVEFVVEPPISANAAAMGDKMDKYVRDIQQHYETCITTTAFSILSRKFSYREMCKMWLTEFNSAASLKREVLELKRQLASKRKREVETQILQQSKKQMV